MVIPAKRKNGRMKPPRPNKKEPKTGPTKYPNEVDISAMAILDSTESGKSSGMKA